MIKKIKNKILHKNIKNKKKNLNNNIKIQLQDIKKNYHKLWKQKIQEIKI